MSEFAGNQGQRPLRAVIVNDTRGDHHFGCHRVMRVIEQNLEVRGIAIAARSLVRNAWWEDRPFLAAMATSDLVVINGEGTCHHGRPHAEKLLQIVEHPACAGKPVALINALYQDNPAAWARYLDRIDLIWTRDSRSADVVREQTGRTTEWVLDLSLSAGLHPHAGHAERNTVTVGDSVIADTARKLIDLSRQEAQFRLLPIVRTLKSPKTQHGKAYEWLREAYIRAHTLAFRIRAGNVVFCRNEFEYAEHLLRSRLHVTGRFHAVCIALTTLTPFLAVASNSWKIEALLSDIGLRRERIVDVRDLRDAVADPKAHAFGPDEASAIEGRLAANLEATGRLFDRIGALALVE